MSAGPPSLRWYASIRSPYSWLALHDTATRCPQLLDRAELRVFFEPDDARHGPAAERAARFHYTPMSRVKHRYILRDVARLAADRGLRVTWPVDTNAQWEVSAIALAATLRADQQLGKRLAYALSTARWQHGVDVHEETQVAEVLRTCDLDPALAVLHATDEGSELGRTLLTELDRDGVFGVPLVIVGLEPFWGIDRLTAAAAAAGLTGSPSIDPDGDPGPKPQGTESGEDAADDHAGGCG